MHFAAHTTILISLIVTFSILLMLLRPRGVAEVYWVSAGAMLLVALHLIPLRLAGQAIGEGTDVYLFLIGMMLLSELARENGVFDWLSSRALRMSQGSCARLFMLVYGIGTLVTIFMSNDATSVVLTPAILAATRKSRVPALPYLFACAFIANAASFVLPISNPANLVVFHQNMPTLGKWLLSFGLPSVVSIVTTYIVLRVIFRTELAEQIQGETKTVELPANGKIVLAGLAVMSIVLLTASSLGKDLGLPTCLAALGITTVICVKARSNPWSLFKEISWGTLALVAALFVLVDAVESVGALRLTQDALQSVQRFALLPAALISSFVVGIANNIINNLPLGLIAGATLQTSKVHGLIANAVLIGVDLGPNLSVTGSLATILWLIALRKEKQDVTFGSFLKVGIIAMPVALLASILAAALMQTIFRTV
jgi:arsenical pump membrane protein